MVRRMDGGDGGGGGGGGGDGIGGDVFSCCNVCYYIVCDKNWCTNMNMQCNGWIGELIDILVDR